MQETLLYLGQFGALKGHKIRQLFSRAGRKGFVEPPNPWPPLKINTKQVDILGEKTSTGKTFSA